MKYLFFAAVVLVGAYFAPQIIESTGSPCHALEAKIVNELRNADPNIGALAGLLSGISNGEIGRQIANQDYPNLPTPLGCVIGYYLKDPREFNVEL